MTYIEKINMHICSKKICKQRTKKIICMLRERQTLPKSVMVKETTGRYNDTKLKS